MNFRAAPIPKTKESWWVGLPPQEFYKIVHEREDELRETKYGQLLMYPSHISGRPQTFSVK